MTPILSSFGGGSARGFGRGRTAVLGPTTVATSLSATPASTSVQLSWTNTDNISQIRVYRAATLVTTLSAASTTYTNTGLSSSTGYSFTIRYFKDNIEGSASNTATTTTLAPEGQQAYTTPGTYLFTVPAGVTAISVVGIGAGSNNLQIESGEVGGNLAYTNNYAVSPGQQYLISIADRAYMHLYPNEEIITYVVLGGNARYNNENYGDVIYYGGNSNSINYGYPGGGGAAGYAGDGGRGGAGAYAYSPGSNGVNAATNSGGGGGGGGGGVEVGVQVIDEVEYPSYSAYHGGGGGGTGILGVGSTGAGGNGSFTAGSGGGGGSGGTNGSGTNGGLYGGGRGGGNYISGNSALRIIWGTGRSYPSAAANV